MGGERDGEALKIKAVSLGGVDRRSAQLDLKTGIVYYTIGDSEKRTLWKF